MLLKTLNRFRPIYAIIIMVFLWCMSQSATASLPTPRLKPPSPHTSNYLTKSDMILFRKGLKSVSTRDWKQLSDVQNRLQDKTAKDLLIWLEVQKNPGASMKDLTHVTNALKDWPRMVSIKAKAEARLWDRPSSPQTTINWFLGQEPVSGEGRAALARALLKSGDTDRGTYWLKSAWTASKLTRTRQKEIFKAYKNYLTPQDHAARADYLIWQGRRHMTKAQALIPLMEPSDRALMTARIRVSGNRTGMDSAIEAVKGQAAMDPGLLYERGRWRRRKKTKEYALPMFLKINRPPVAEIGKTRLWREKKIMAYWAISKKRYDEAYRLTLHHGFERGIGFAEAEFLAGWLSLIKLNNPDQALKHFEKLATGVSTPVSLSRAEYWIGRAHEARRDGQASINYAKAARFPNTFYGFLASEKLGSGTRLVSLPLESRATHLQTNFESDPRIRAMHLLGEVQEDRYFKQFAYHMDDEFQSLELLSLLSNLSKKYGYMQPSLRAAKQASRFQSMLTESGYPMPDAITRLSSKFDIPFVLAIARQESEFEYRAVSHANAYGIMQMINSTARMTARKHRIPYSRARLTTDVNYSAHLGALHLNDLLDRFDGSYILSAAAYNAGSHRVQKWIKTYGDPRDPNIDPIDWMESIPFSETRNYVHRVMENMQVYRARLNGNVAPNQVYHDITNGAF